MRISTVRQMNELDRGASEEFGIPGEVLMENAAGAVRTAIERELATSLRGGRVIVLCGPGNNGGDGLALARKLFSDGAEVEVALLGDPGSLSGPAELNWKIVSRLPLEVRRPLKEGLGGLRESLARSTAVVDAVFGTGITRDVEGDYRRVLQLINEKGERIVSIDIPSGINGDTGQEMGLAVEADCTVTFGLPKRGNLIYPGYARGGKLYLSRISFPPALTESETIETFVNEPPALPPRDPQGHKGSFGRVLFVAGAANYYWAPYSSAQALYEAGGGYAYLACPRSLAPVIGGMETATVLWPQPEDGAGRLTEESWEKISSRSELERMAMAVVGPGLSRGGELEELVRKLTEGLELPLLLDGDGLNAISNDQELIKARSEATVLTPHPGEMARLTGRSIEEVEANRVEILRETSAGLGAIIVLKGPHSLIGYPSGEVYLNPSGNSAMATAGSGDPLTGTIAAIYGLGLELGEAVRTGVFLHGLAGDIAARQVGKDGTTASDVLNFLPAALKEYREERESMKGEHYGLLQLL